MSKIRQVFTSPSGIVFLVVIAVFLSNIRLFPSREDEVTAFFLTLGALVWAFIVPMFLLRFLFKENPNRFGWRLPENFPKTLVFALFSLILLVPITFYFGEQQAFRDFYLMRGLSVSSFLLVSVTFSFVYYFAEEFLFRGFMFWGLFRRIGYHSFWVTSVVFAAFHAGKPFPEFIFSFFASLLFCYLALRAKSFVPAFVVHYVMALVLNIIIVFS